MFNSIVLDVVIGLVFIYLLYSLFVTILSELIATFLGLRARNLKEAIDRMLNDEEPVKWWRRLWDSLKLTKSPNNEVVNAFYNHPEIKYLGSSGVFKHPSSFKASSFSKTIMSMLAGTEPVTKESMQKKLVNEDNLVFYAKEKLIQPPPLKPKCLMKYRIRIAHWWKRNLWKRSKNEVPKSNEEIIDHLITFFQNPNFNEKNFTKSINDWNKNLEKEWGRLIKLPLKSVGNICKQWEESGKDPDKFKLLLKNWINTPKPLEIDIDTAAFIRSIWLESQGDMEKFKLLLEGWFDRTMEQTIEWYKRKIRVITFVLGFLVAWFFYADTFMIVKSLSTDKGARDQLVSMANTYVENYQKITESTKVLSENQIQSYNAKMDSLLTITTQLQNDLTKANNILGFGGWPPDTIYVNLDLTKNNRTFNPPVDEKSLPSTVISSITKKLDSLKEQILIKDMLIKRDTLVKKETKAVNKLSIKEGFSIPEKFTYLGLLFCNHFFGFLVTAIAISLGAPFWFDLLNKIMKLKTSQTEETKTKNGLASSDSVSPLNRVG